MPIYLGETKKTLFKGDYHPAEYYKGSEKITGYTNEPCTGTELSADDTYNDSLFNTPDDCIEGKSWQSNNTPSPDNPSPILSSGESNVVVEGKNLFNCNTTTKGLSVNTSGVIVALDTESYASYYLIIPPTQSITFNMKNLEIVNSSVIRCGYFDSFPVLGSVGTRFVLGSSATINPNGKWTFVGFTIRLLDTQDLTGLSGSQIEYGEFPTPYQPYQAPITLPMPEGFGGIGDIRDRIYKNDGKVYWEKKSNEVVFDGSEDEKWDIQSTNSYNIVNFRLYPTFQTSNTAQIVTNLLGRQTTSIEISKAEGFLYSNNTFYARLLSSRASITSDFRQLLQQNPITVRYALATPETIDITDTPTGQAFLKAKTYPYFTHIYSNADENIKPTINTKIKQCETSNI